MVIRSRKLQQAIEEERKYDIPHHIVFEGPFEDVDRWDNPFQYWIVAIKNSDDRDIKHIRFKSPDRAEEYAREQTRELNIELHIEAAPSEEYRGS